MLVARGAPDQGDALEIVGEDAEEGAALEDRLPIDVLQREDRQVATRCVLGQQVHPLHLTALGVVGAAHERTPHRRGNEQDLATDRRRRRLAAVLTGREPRTDPRPRMHAADDPHAEGAVVAELRSLEVARHRSLATGPGTHLPVAHGSETEPHAVERVTVGAFLHELAPDAKLRVGPRRPPIGVGGVEAILGRDGLVVGQVGAVAARDPEVEPAGRELTDRDVEGFVERREALLLPRTVREFGLVEIGGAS